MLWKKAVLSAAEQRPRLLALQGMFQMPASQHQHRRGSLPVSDASSSAPADGIHKYIFADIIAI